MKNIISLPAFAATAAIVSVVIGGALISGCGQNNNPDPQNYKQPPASNAAGNSATGNSARPRVIR